MSIFIYNSLSRKKEEFIPLEPDKVRMYVCGPTVYDVPHIGHARSTYVFDVIRRYFISQGFSVKFVRNVTDVDDKIIDRAQKEFPGEDLVRAVKKVSDKYLALYHEDMRSLGILDPDVEPKATAYVAQDKPLMQKFIQQLIDNGCAYVSGGDVYFDIKKAKNYGKLSNQDLKNMESGARIAPGEKKKDALDFALWKSAKPNEPSWESPWGRGRPGWHIECSVMSSDILGDVFDIHGGGIDLIFPHHENEVAQSEGAGKKFARYWMHHGLLTINGQKMSKSLGNFVTVKDFLDKYQDADLLKLLFLSAHYAHPIDYTDQKIEDTKQALDRIHIFLNKAGSSFEQEVLKESMEIQEVKARFAVAMNDNFNTPEALACIFDLVKIANKHIEDVDFTHTAGGVLRSLCQVLGLTLEGKSAAAVITEEEIKVRIASREQARLEKKYALADEIRKDLETKGVILEDTKDGTTWRRKL